MLLRDELLFIASVLRDGDAGPHAQILASHRLARIADTVQRMEEQLDAIVGFAQAEADAAMAAAQSERALVPLRARPCFRLVQA